MGGEKLPSAFITQILALLLCILGFLTAYGLVLMNKGSKAWNANWESHIEILEDEFEGKLHKTHLFKDGNKFPSVSKVNTITSEFLRCFWFISAFATSALICVTEFNEYIIIDKVTLYVIVKLGFLGLIIYGVFYFIKLCCCSNTGNEDDNRPHLTQRTTIPTSGKKTKPAYKRIKICRRIILLILSRAPH